MYVHDVSVLRGFDGIPFGTKRKEARNALLKATGLHPAVFKKGLSKNTADEYDGFHVYYDSHDCLEAVEFFGESNVKCDGHIVFPADVKIIMDQADDWIQDDTGWVSVSKSIGIYAPENDMESLLFAKEDYYEGLF